ncbi:hypothetical protein HDU81_000785 [Chytriomyces hyalinus]|nr:hypothetical protein HDU81_000785 [Chytriomyces hyalinus]
MSLPEETRGLDALSTTTTAGTEGATPTPVAASSQTHPLEDTASHTDPVPAPAAASESTNTDITTKAAPVSRKSAQSGQRQSSICHHSKRRSQCVQCYEEGTGGSTICKHLKQKYACRKCFDEGNAATNSLCEHRLIRIKCKTCTPFRPEPKTYRPRIKLDTLTEEDLTPFFMLEAAARGDGASASKTVPTEDMKSDEAGEGSEYGKEVETSDTASQAAAAADTRFQGTQNLLNPECLKCGKNKKIIFYGMVKRPFCKSCWKVLHSAMMHAKHIGSTSSRSTTPTTQLAFDSQPPETISSPYAATDTPTQSSRPSSAAKESSLLVEPSNSIQMPEQIVLPAAPLPVTARKRNSAISQTKTEQRTGASEANTSKKKPRRAAKATTISSTDDAISSTKRKPKPKDSPTVITTSTNDKLNHVLLEAATHVLTPGATPSRTPPTKEEPATIPCTGAHLPPPNDPEKPCDAVPRQTAPPIDSKITHQSLPTSTFITLDATSQCTYCGNYHLVGAVVHADGRVLCARCEIEDGNFCEDVTEDEADDVGTISACDDDAADSVWMDTSEREIVFEGEDVEMASSEPRRTSVHKEAKVLGMVDFLAAAAAAAAVVEGGEEDGGSRVPSENALWKLKEGQMESRDGEDESCEAAQILATLGGFM